MGIGDWGLGVDQSTNIPIPTLPIYQFTTNSRAVEIAPGTGARAKNLDLLNLPVYHELRLA